LCAPNTVFPKFDVGKVRVGPQFFNDFEALNISIPPFEVGEAFNEWLQVALLHEDDTPS
jgi:hypothetical protein